ncbi:hypothetical protein DQ04_14571010, partial [Trypanosoma grayi]|uniref:hypothetical protein n=1 Tax=Trypanosoma grayi TaxID=71804 RepID=UPI0004F40371
RSSAAARTTSTRGGGLLRAARARRCHNTFACLTSQQVEKQQKQEQRDTPRMRARIRWFCRHACLAHRGQMSVMPPTAGRRVSPCYAAAVRCGDFYCSWGLSS